MFVLLYLIIAMIHIPVTIQRSLVISCLDRKDPTCQEHQDIISRDQNALEPYFAYIVYPRTYQQNAYKNSKIGKKYKSKTVDDMSLEKLLKGKEKKLWAHFAIPLIVGGSQIITAVIEKFGHLIME